MKTLYLIRHTRPDIAPGICYGQLDIDLADGFEQEAATVLNWLPGVPLLDSHVKPDLILASPLLRCRKLAEYLSSARGCKLSLDARLMEKHSGSWEGVAWDEIARDEIDAWADDVMDYAPNGGESANRLMRRTGDFLLDLAQLPQKHIALVAHGGSIRAILALLANVPLEKTLNWQIDYGTVILVRVSFSASADLGTAATKSPIAK